MKRIAAYLWPRQVALVSKFTAIAIVLALVGTGYSVLSRPSSLRPAAHAAAAPRLGVRSAAATTSSAKAAAAAAALQLWYNGRAYRGARWWQSAIALSTVVRYMQVSGSRAYVGDLAATYHAFHRTKNFTRNYYDDMGWWALAWAQAYGLTRDKRYLAEAEHIFAAMTGGWDGVCGGGIPWSKLGYYKNAISNELFLDVAATLHNLVPGDVVYGQWALREWRWFRSSGLITSSHLVVDGLDKSCRPILTSPTWTYNQGVLIGGLVQLSRIPGSGRPLRAARKVAAAVMGSGTLSPDGILTEPCEQTGCGRDGVIFKGVFAQNLGLLVARSPRPAFAAYLRGNADSMWDHDRMGDVFGLRWTGPFDVSGSARQISALALLTARLAVAAS